jgi:hypothetical protein
MLFWLLWLGLEAGRAAATVGPAGAPGAAAPAARPAVAAQRRLDYAAVGPRLRFSSDDDPIVASVYCLPSSYFDAGEAARLLAAVRAAAPRRELLVLTDPPLLRALAPRLPGGRMELLESGGRAFSPWPRDPFSFTHEAGGGLVVLVRPNVQRTREEDLFLGPALVAALPPGLDRAWGGSSGVGWTEAPVPFHNGQVLMTREAAWISVHTLEPRVLALLGVDRVPVDSFASAPGVARYVGAARQAAAELAGLYGRPVRFVHPLPPEGDRGSPLMQRIGGGAGYDLDSLLTLLPGARGGGSGQGSRAAPGRAPVALVASVAAGKRLLAAASAADLSALGRGYALAPEPAALRATLAAAQESPREAALDAFLDLVAGHLAGAGFTVRRLPLVAIPTALLASGGDGGGAAEFFLTWNNVVVEARPGKQVRAEGFASLLAPGDAEARRVFAAAGCHLDLLPPLVFSVVRNGGYRCASNQVRAAPR